MAIVLGRNDGRCLLGWHVFVLDAHDGWSQSEIIFFLCLLFAEGNDTSFSVIDW